MVRSTPRIPDTPHSLVDHGLSGGQTPLGTRSPRARGRCPGQVGHTRRLSSVDGVDERSVAEADPGVDEPGLDRIWTVPNVVTFVRLACIPLYVWLLFGADRQTWAAVVLAVLGATDWVDGYVARRFHQVTTLGKVIDPVADRVLVLTAVLTIMIHGAVPVWFGVATLAAKSWCPAPCCCSRRSVRPGSMCCGWVKRERSH